MVQEKRPSQSSLTKRRRNEELWEGQACDSKPLRMSIITVNSWKRLGGVMMVLALEPQLIKALGNGSREILEESQAHHSSLW